MHGFTRCCTSDSILLSVSARYELSLKIKDAKNE